MATAKERIALREQKTLTEGGYLAKGKWEQFHRHECAIRWKAMEMAEGGAASDDRKERLIIPSFSPHQQICEQWVIRLRPQQFSNLLPRRHRPPLEPARR